MRALAEQQYMRPHDFSVAPMCSQPLVSFWPQGDVLKLLDDVAELKPSQFIGVPRVFDRIYSRVMGEHGGCMPAREFGRR